MMIIGIIILLFILCMVDLIKNKKVLSPSFCYNFIWLIVLSLYQLKLSYTQHNLTNRTCQIFLFSILSYNITLLICKKIKFNFKRKKIKFGYKGKIEDKIKIAKIIAILVFLIEIIYSKGLPLIWKIIGNGKTYFDFGIPSLNGAFYGLIICLGAYSIFNKNKDKYLYLAIGILVLSRQVIISMVLEGLIYAIYNKKINKRKVIIVMICGIIGFNLLGNLRSGNNTMNNVFKPREQYKNLPSTIKWEYSYLTFSVSNFNNLVMLTNGGANHGISMLSEFMPTVLLNKLNLKEKEKINYLVSNDYTVSTYMPGIYLDFGLYGIVIFNILIAILGYILYKKSLEQKNKKNILMYSVFAHNIIFLFFVNMFLYLPIIIQFIYIPLIYGESENEEKNN